MKKYFILNILIVAFVFQLQAQRTLINTHPDALFNQAKESYQQGNYTASFQTMEDYLQTTEDVQAGQIHEAQFYLAASAFQLRRSEAFRLLEDFLLVHYYTPFADRANAMLGTLLFEQKKYKVALTYLEKVNDHLLGKRERVDFLFNKGYASVEEKNYGQARIVFMELKSMKTRYDLSATYYYAYSEYCLKNYEVALPEMQKLEDKPEYQNIVPYYIIQILYAQKEYEQLGERAEKLLKNNPANTNNAEIYRIMGEIAYRKKNYAKAIEYLKNYEKLFPQVLRNDMYLLGLSYFQLKDYTNTIQYLSKVTTANDEMTENAYLHLGNSYVKNKDITNARLAYEASLRTNFNKSVREEALFNYALTSYQSTSAFGESIKAFEQFLAEFPASKHQDEAYDYLSSVFLTTKNYEEAYKSISKISNPSPKLLETKHYLLYQLGVDAFALNEMAKAIEYFNQALQLSSSGKYSAECLFWRAECNYRTNHYNETISDIKAFFNNSKSKNSANRVAANYTEAYGYFALKNYDEALKCFLKYIDNESNAGVTTYSDALNRIGDCYYYQRNFTKAGVYYDKAIVSSPNTGDYASFQSAYVAGLQKNYSLKVVKLEKLLVTYPKSEYADNALYEMGRAYLLKEDNDKAIATYNRLLKTRPNSDAAPKAALEIGMIYFNENNFEQAIIAYKNVIATYPGSEESYTALESLETVYVEINDVAAYLAYTKTLGRSIRTTTASREDSISYIASEKQYMNGKYAQAISGLQAYLKKFCPGGRYCTSAQYYLADSYYKTDDKANALTSYDALLKISGNEYAEEAAMRCAEITFDKKDFSAALNFFKEVQKLAQSTENRNVGRLGVLRCSSFLNDNETTVKVATEVISDANSPEEMILEARYNRAKAFIGLKQSAQALGDLQVLASDTRTANGAEAKYLIANAYFEQGKYTEAENEVTDFIKKNTPHQFWLARSFVLLADVYIKQNNDFQAKQYLLSLKKNYTAPDEIQTLINERLTAIEEREKQNIIG